ncbi:hypothetical protein [Rhodococcus erythropolis]|uniref:hypothetical protein n=1 Tax=Rhodococcus erythropolis TaxID=1833 RepID=UPI0024B798A1|nr:hypothetical protein [Rhodococcus erythropolis]MDJ0014959.1 hypothetical protein [Rhodococcus erythropolis]
MTNETASEVTAESARQAVLEAIQESAVYTMRNNPHQTERVKDLAEALAWLKSSAQSH